MKRVPDETTTATPDCAHCGFTWAPITRPEITARLGAAVEAFIGIVEEAGPLVSERPSSDRWSILEYGGHVRDVLLSIRERVILAAVVDVPVGSPIFRDERIDLGFYSHDTPVDVVVELHVMANLFLKTVATLPAGFEDRGLIYSTRTPIEITISSALSNAVHECEHHLGDARDVLSLLRASS